ncbi:binding-protein-dependent transport systems inner membrane component [Chthoniobacter flavus Ellin428]|uniref:Oligopeptide transport system permease protein OppC n=1 Tax=Chthoniobacter flavus Ellin428 TaxID=497964 RepID=B4D3Q6_9BACT|nr:ABC transporter permease [Chthoniobacter flavus]EDY18886.1 binding-protein-dependent transport systems inner membrane component [Chthoniobacter flavus Ellin428]TCO93477.1 peptide/nickel transport system permease protein/oligopeptide transport system permease protein [Chthoniobacter flavus]
MSDALPPPPGTWARLRKNPVAMGAMLILAVIVFAAIFGPLLYHVDPHATSRAQYQPPGHAHYFGTDNNGRDSLARILEGARISLLVGFSGAFISLFVGTTYGLVSGYLGGRADNIMMRLVEILYALPRLIILILFTFVFDTHFKIWLAAHGYLSMVGYSKIIILILALGLIEWLTMARIVRGQVLSLKNLQFVTAARALGQSHARIIFRHLLPNIAGIVIVYLTLTIPAVILDESFLSFLGLGVQAPQASWGSLLSDGAQVINPVHSYWWLLLYPALVMSITLLSLNFLGDALRDALDPRARR